MAKLTVPKTKKCSLRITRVGKEWHEENKTENPGKCISAGKQWETVLDGEDGEMAGMSNQQSGPGGQRVRGKHDPAAFTALTLQSVCKHRFFQANSFWLPQVLQSQGF